MKYSLICGAFGLPEHQAAAYFIIRFYRGYKSHDNLPSHYINGQWVKAQSAQAFNGNAPFGGYKQSGNGRENGVFGFEEFLELKSLQFKAT